MAESNLKYFLNPKPVETVEYVASERFCDGEGAPIKWLLKPISGRDNAELQEQATVRTKSGSRLNQTKYANLLTAACVKSPNLNDKELQTGYGASSAEQLLPRMLTAGELVNLQNKITEINGFNNSIDELADEAKN